MLSSSVKVVCKLTRVAGKARCTRAILFQVRRKFSVSVSGHNCQKLTDRVVIITGAADGIGRATAKLFQANGAKVYAVDIDGNGLLALTDECNAEPSMAQKITGIVGDVSDEECVAEYMKQIYGETKQIDSLLNIAGYQGAFKLIHETETADVRKHMNVNYFGSYFNVKYAVPLMMETQKKQRAEHNAKSGIRNGNGNGNGNANDAPNAYKTIVNTSSMAGKMGGAFCSAYNASKFAVVGLTKCVAAEYGAMNIRCNSVLPGAINTKMMNATFDFCGGTLGMDMDQFIGARVGLQKVGQPEDVAKMFLFLASDDSSYCHGQEYSVDGQFLGKV